MALLSYWKDAIKANPLLLSSAVEHGIRVFGYECIKSEQLTAIQSLLSGVSVFMSVPTGFGKSLVFQVLPFCVKRLLRSGRSESMKPVVVVVSPQLSLMHDQVTKLVSKDVKAVYVSGDAVDFQADILDGRVTCLGAQRLLLALPVSHLICLRCLRTGHISHEHARPGGQEGHHGFAKYM